MLKKIKLNNSTILLMGIIFVVVGACIPGYLVAGLTKNWVAALAVGFVVMIGALFVLTKKDAKNA